MAEIRLEGITKIYTASGIRWLSSGGVRTSLRDYSDKAFIERVASQEVAAPRGQGPVHALDHLSLKIENGETMAVVGPSGCGKSTLLRVVAGLETLDEGLVYYDDRVMNDVPPKDRGIGMVFQSYALYPNMPGEGNLSFFFRLRRRPPEEIMERIRVTSEIMGIGFDQLLERKPGTLSGGQQQRVAIGRCIVRDPKLFLFDEPLSNLDAKLRVSTRVEIKRLLHRFNITAIYVTHDQTEAITLGDRIAVMREGKIAQLGTYQEITDNPDSAFVAGFLGLQPMNLLRGWQVTDEGEMVSEFGRVRVPAALAGQVRPGQKMILGFRGVAARFVPEGEEASIPGLRIAAEVVNCEPDFARHYQTINMQAANVFFGVAASLDVHINSGWRVTVVIPEEAAYLFDQETDARVRGLAA